MTRVTFIAHSCFAVESDGALIVFDYWKDSPDRKLHTLLQENSKPLYFVVSHFHEDHYNPAILGIEGARLLLSYDTARRRRVDKHLPYAILHPGDDYEDECLKLHACSSTDVGMSSLVTLPDGTTLYHAGDNNNWYFPHDEEEHIRCSVDEMEGMFMSNLREVRNLVKSVDHVMFPIDPRLESEMLRGACQWLQQIKTGHLYPMHTWDCWKEVNEGVRELRDLFPETQIGNRIFFKN